MERIIALEEDVVATHDEGEPTEIPVETPAAPVSESATAHASASDFGTESNAESQLQADRKPIPIPVATTARTSGNIRQARSNKKTGKDT